MLSSKTVEIWAFPHKNLPKENTKFCIPSQFLEKGILLRPDVHWRIKIYPIEEKDIPRAPSWIGQNSQADHTRGYKFVLSLSRDIISYYIDKVIHKLTQDKVDYNSIRRKNGLKGVLFNSLLTSDFNNKCMLFISSINVSSIFCFPVSEVRFFYYDKETVGEKIIFSHRNLYFQENFDFDKINDVKFFDFIQNIRSELIEGPSTQFSRAFSYFMHSIANRKIRSIDTLVWSLAGIEALVGQKGRSSRYLVEQRLQVILPELTQPHLLQKFKNLYDLRSNIIHGAESVSAPFSRNSESNDLQIIHFGNYAQCILIHLMHKYFKLNKYNINFGIHIKP